MWVSLITMQNGEYVDERIEVKDFAEAKIALELIREQVQAEQRHWHNACVRNGKGCCCPSYDDWWRSTYVM